MKPEIQRLSSRPQSMDDFDTSFKNGFTLLEMIVVLSILGLISAIAFPRLGTVYSSLEKTTQKDDLTNQIKLLNFKAYQSGKKFSLAEAVEEEELIKLPEGWHLVSGKQITYSEIGVCSGGEATFQSDNTFISFKLEAPLCEPEIL